MIAAMSRSDRNSHWPFGLTLVGCRRRILAALILASIAGSAGVAGAAPARDEDDGPPDARIEGYTESVSMPGGAVGTLLALGLTGAVAVGVMFKSSNRTHLD